MVQMHFLKHLVHFSTKVSLASVGGVGVRITAYIEIDMFDT
jgi:hypothetical protein